MITNEIDQADCYGSIAVARQDGSICDKIPSALLKDNCYMKVAVAKKDPAVCIKIQDADYRDTCYWDIAKAKQDPSICDSVQDPNNRNYCYTEAGAAKDPTSCEKMTGYARDRCYYDYAFETGIIATPAATEICDKIQDPDLKAMCKTGYV